MTRVTLEVELDLETSYRPGKPARFNPPPGDPPEDEEIEVIAIDQVLVEDRVIQLDPHISEALLEALQDVKEIRAKIEEQVREAACG